MRVVHATDCYLPRLGGIEVHLDGLTRHQEASGHDVEVWTPTPAGAGPSPLTGPGRIPSGRVVVRRLGARADGVAPTTAAAVRDLRRLLDGDPPDVLHAHVSVLSPLATAAVRMAALRGVPTVVTVHSMWGHLRPLPSVARALMRLRSWPVCWSAVSEAAAQPLREALGPQVPVHVLGNAVDVDWWRVPRVDPAVPTLVSVLRFARTKKPYDLVRVLAGIRAALPSSTPLRAVLVGDGPLRPRARSLAGRLGIDSWVSFPGRLDHEAIRDLLAESSVYLSVSPWESFGIAALEARAVGLPVVGHARSGVSDVVEHGVSGYVAPDVAGMAAAAAGLVGDPRLHAAMTRRNVEQPPRHTWAHAQVQTDELYAAAVRRAATPAAVEAGR